MLVHVAVAFLTNTCERAILSIRAAFPRVCSTSFSSGESAQTLSLQFYLYADVQTVRSLPSPLLCKSQSIHIWLLSNQRRMDFGIVADYRVNGEFSHIIHVILSKTVPLKCIFWTAAYLASIKRNQVRAYATTDCSSSEVTPAESSSAPKGKMSLTPTAHTCTYGDIASSGCGRTGKAPFA